VASAVLSSRAGTDGGALAHTYWGTRRMNQCGVNLDGEERGEWGVGWGIATPVGRRARSALAREVSMLVPIGLLAGEKD
jgi:D-aminopeptidase